MTMDKIGLTEFEIHVMQWFVKNKPDASNQEVAEACLDFGDKLLELNWFEKGGK